MKKIGLLSLLSFIGLAAFAAFPVESQILLTEADPDKFKLDTVAFMIGILTFWMMFLFGLPLLLLFINKKNFRGSLAWGWLAGLLLPFLIGIIIFASEDFSFAY
tara:strand:- start:275 stop:586 length:312 start_codon:yes stop_codon:yes gene_type:complete